MKLQFRPKFLNLLKVQIQTSALVLIELPNHLQDHKDLLRLQITIKLHFKISIRHLNKVLTHLSQEIIVLALIKCPQ